MTELEELSKAIQQQSIAISQLAESVSRLVDCVAEDVIGDEGLDIVYLDGGNADSPH